MKTVGAYEAKTSLPQLLNEAAGGDSILITRNGEPVAMPAPVPSGKPEPKAAIEQIRAFRKGKKLAGLSVREMKEEGRR